MSRTSPGNSRLRIIGGQWRSRKLPIPDADGLRPTPDRVRETLFNWLQTTICGSRCLDLFSGSGALTFEALSRDARHVTLVEKQRSVAYQLANNIDLLKCSDRAQLLQMDAMTAIGLLIKQRSSPFDIVFLDPPFYKGLLLPAIKALMDAELILPHTLLYIEAERTQRDLDELEGWKYIRKKEAGQIWYALAQQQ